MNENFCIHSSKYVKNLSSVFTKQDGKFVIIQDGAPEDQIRKVVTECPSTALKIEEWSLVALFYVMVKYRNRNLNLLKSLVAIFLGAIMLFAIIPGYDTFAAKPDNVGKPEFAITVKEALEPKTVKLADGRIAEKVTHIFYKEGFSHKPDHAKGGGPPDKGEKGGGEKCYTVLAKSAEWKYVENYIVNPTNTRGMSDMFVSDTFAASLASWNAASPRTIFGSEVTGLVDVIDKDSPDGKNEIMFGSIDKPGVIAVTITWGIYGGPPQNRALVEWDALFNEVDFDWGDADLEEKVVMDLQNIATHEFGHAAGLGHPDNTCTEETMYAFASYDETQKRTLEAGDIAGINDLYWVSLNF